MKTSTKGYHYTESGLSNIFLRNGYTIETIDGEEYTSIDDIDNLHRAIALLLVEKDTNLKSNEFRFIRELLNLSRSNLSNLLGYDQQTIGRWEKDETPIPKNIDVILRQIYLESINKTSALSYHLKRLANAESQAFLDDIILETKKHSWLKAI